MLSNCQRRGCSTSIAGIDTWGGCDTAEILLQRHGFEIHRLSVGLVGCVTQLELLLVTRVVSTAALAPHPSGETVPWINFAHTNADL